MKVSNQAKVIKKGFDISNHSLFSAVAQAIAAKIEKDTGMKVSLQGKQVQGHKISASLVGQAITDSEEISKKVRRTMDSLKNPATIIDALK